MSNPEDPLNTGVEIMARLPGKKAQRMTLLSGGEKALTAISLIFALLKTKPTPFCFLDEVDARLMRRTLVGITGFWRRFLTASNLLLSPTIAARWKCLIHCLALHAGAWVSKIVGVDMKRDIPEHLKKAFKEEDRVGASAH